MAKRFTILVIPEGTHRVKRFTLHRLVLPLALTVLVGSMGLCAYWFLQYQGLRNDLPSIQSLKDQNQRQEVQIKAFAKSITGLREQMSRLKAFNHRLRVMANLEKPGDPEAFFGVGGPEAGVDNPGVKLSNTVREREMQRMQREIDQLSAASETEKALQEELAKFLHERRSVLAATPSIWPTQGWVTSGYGYRISPWTGKRHFHTGIDISTRLGSPVASTAEGVVTFAGQENGFGRMLVINHGHGLVSRYAHLHQFKVKVGQKVKRGQVVGLVGNSGRSTGPHLHYEVLLSGVPTNPRYYILD